MTLLLPQTPALLLPEGARLLHVGPAKTGTTSLQRAFHSARPRLQEHGVHYAGPGTQPRAAAGALVTGRRIAGHRAGAEAWPALVEEVQRSVAARTVISSETFARADDAAAARVVEAFGADRTHVVITMRPLADMLPSSWQQYVQTGSVERYGDWLHRMLDPVDTLHGPQPEFWRKTRIDALVDRWGALVGPERVTVVSLADRPHDFVLRTFEALTGLPEGLLALEQRSANASLGHGAAEVLRRFNERFAQLPGADADRQAMLVEFGLVRRLRRDPSALAGDRPIELPVWAADRAASIVREMTARIEASGVRLVGDLAALERPSRPPVPELPDVHSIDAEAAAAMLVGMLLAAGHGMPAFARSRQAADLAATERLGTGLLVRTAASRVAQRLRARLPGR